MTAHLALKGKNDNALSVECFWWGEGKSLSGQLDGLIAFRYGLLMNGSPLNGSPLMSNAVGEVGLMAILCRLLDG